MSADCGNRWPSLPRVSCHDRCTSTAMTVCGKAGRNWVARDRVGVAYDRHDALKNEAAYARHYKYMATMPLLHYTHMPLAESRTTYSTD